MIDQATDTRVQSTIQHYHAISNAMVRRFLAEVSEATQEGVNLAPILLRHRQEFDRLMASESRKLRIAFGNNH